MIDFQNLRLETVKIPKNIASILEEDGYWEEFDAFDPFSIMINTIERNGKDAMLFTFEFHPHEVEELNEKLEAKGYETFGYDWAEYLLAMLQKKKVLFLDEISEDSEGATCVLNAYNPIDFINLLKNISEIIRDLYNS
ncbi:MAG: hypothetical protein EAZ95_00295 [Bacteroidetes bacterium]|nr:MAG: hypothetical protein EAZ95_00295 [Bacteroidota bacterium]